MTTTSTERQRKFVAANRAAGIIRVSYWIPSKLAPLLTEFVKQLKKGKTK